MRMRKVLSKHAHAQTCPRAYSPSSESLTMQAEEFKSLLSSSGIPVHTDLENDFIGIVQLFKVALKCVGVSVRIG